MNHGIPLNKETLINGVKVWYFEQHQFLPNISWKKNSKSIGFCYAPRLNENINTILNNIDIVNIQSPFIYPAFLTSLKSIRKKKPLFYHARGNFLKTHLQHRAFKKWLYIQIVEKYILKRATCLIALNQAEKKAFAEIVPYKKCEIVPNGVEIPDRNDSRTLAHNQKKWGIPKNSEVILFLGRIHPWKGVELLLQSFLEITEERPSAILVIAGEDNANLMPDLVKRYQETIREKKIFYLGPIYNKKDKSDLFFCCSIFCLPSRGEAFSMAILEALAHSCPVVITEDCNFPQIKEYNAGLIVKRNKKDISAAILKILRNQEHLKTMQSNAQKLANIFSWPVVVGRLSKIYAAGLKKSVF